MLRTIIYAVLFSIISLLFVSRLEAVTTSQVLASNRLAVAQNNLFNRIASCESKNDPHARNPNSTASGRFQFLWSSWNYYGKQLWGEDFYKKNIFDYNDSTELAWYVFQKNGTKDWDASKKCWLPALDT